MLFRLRQVGGSEPRRWDLAARPIYIGRAPGNDIIVTDDAVSGRHAAVFAAGDRAFVEDLRSKNGTFVQDVRVRGVARVQKGDVIQLGGTLKFEVEADTGANAEAAVVPVLEDVAAQLTVPFRTDRITIGRGPRVDVALPDGPDEAAVLLADGDGTVWLGINDETRPLAVGEAFDVGGRPFRLAAARFDITRTSDLLPSTFRYALDAGLEPTGAEATLSDPDSARIAKFANDNRAMLLFLLALKMKQDVSAGVTQHEAGWCHDEELGDGIWGRPGRTKLVNNLHVLVCRTRRELRDAGFDPWCIEKRNRLTRARVGRVAVRGEERVTL